MDEHGLLDCPDDAVCLHAHNSETVHTYSFSCSLAVMVDEREGSEIFLHLSPKVIPDSPMFSSKQSASSI